MVEVYRVREPRENLHGDSICSNVCYVYWSVDDLDSAHELPAK